MVIKALLVFFMDNLRIRLTYERESISGEIYIRSGTKNMLCFIHVKIKFQKIPFALIKMKGIDWYFCLEKEKDNVFTLKHQSRIEKSDYLICELTSPDNFELNPGYQTCVTFYDNI